MVPHRAFWVLLLSAPALSSAGEALHFFVDPSGESIPVSPYVYGLNWQEIGDTGATVRRMGGNRMTAYNWENNASNAGSDWKHVNDDWPCSDVMKLKDCHEPGRQAEAFVERNREAGAETLLTLPMAGWVAADKDGEVPESQTAPSVRFHRSLPRKKGGFSLPPNRKDRTVYQDEFVHFLVERFGKAREGGVAFYAFDNEPALWSHTHPRIHPKPASWWEVVNKTEALAAAVLRVDSGARLFGPVLYGWQAFHQLQDAPEAGDAALRKKYETFLDFYLDQMEHRSRLNKRRLLHVLDLHWYPEAQGNGKRITEGDTAPESVTARLQAPRSLWDPDYVEESWITKYSTKGKAIRLIPWVREKIERWYPGTELAFTEYDYGAGDHISGALAQADVLGIFGREGIFLAAYWGDLKPYAAAAFRLFRNYDGKGAKVGGRALKVVQADPQAASVYAFTDPEAPGRTWILALQKDLKKKRKFVFEIAGAEEGTLDVWRLDGEDPQIRRVEKGRKFSHGRLEVSLPPLSATLFVVDA